MRSNHLRHCPRHRRPLPCAHCALAQKAAQTPPAVIAAVDPSPKSASAIRAAKWREKEKQNNPQFAQQEAERKRKERAEIERVQAIEDTLRENPNPPLVMNDAPHGKGLLVTGKYDSEKIAEIADKHQLSENGRRVTPKGWGATGGKNKNINRTPANELPEEFDDSFMEKSFKKFRKPRELRILHQFIFELTEKSPMLVCRLCKQQIAPGNDPGENIEAGFHHFRTEHAEQFGVLLGLLKKTACTEDHEGMVRRHGDDTLPVKCGRCKKILWKPPRKPSKPRSDKPVKVAA